MKIPFISTVFKRLIQLFLLISATQYYQDVAIRIYTFTVTISLHLVV